MHVKQYQLKTVKTKHILIALIFKNEFSKILYIVLVLYLIYFVIFVNKIIDAILNKGQLLFPIIKLSIFLFKWNKIMLEKGKSIKLLR